jgi:pyridoxine 4-dehydrogenase
MQNYSPSSLTFPVLGYGTWAWGNRFLWDYNPQMDIELQAVFNFLVDQGITFFDTGDSYGTGALKGRSEILLGQFTKNYGGKNKDRLILATKLAPYPWRLTPQSMIKAAQQSRDRLGRPIDLVQLHWSTRNYFPWQEKPLLKGLAMLYQQGLVKGVGLSNFGTKALLEVDQWFREWGVPITSLQVQYSLLSTASVNELGVKETCDRLGIKLIAYSPLALGLLTGKYQVGGALPKGVRGSTFKRLLPQIEPLLKLLEGIAQQRGKTMAQVALNWCLMKGIMPIPGAKNLAQAKENLGALNWRLSVSEIEELDKVSSLIKGKMVQNPFQSK